MSIGANKGFRVGAYPARDGSGCQGAIRLSDTSAQRTKQWILLVTDAMHVQVAVPHHPSDHSAGRLAGARFGISQEINITSVFATTSGQQPGSGKIESVVGAEQCHQLAAARRQVSRRDSPIRPWFARICSQISLCP